MIAFFLAGLSWQLGAQVQNAEVYEFPGLKQKKLLNYRYHINIPDIDGFETLKCDFHMHTDFSDGYVLPAMRVIEAWNDGLDAIAITDHIETKNRKNKDNLEIDLNKSNEIALNKGNELGIIIVKGAEITRQKPFGHINALFVQDISKMDVPDELDAVNAAVDQGAFLLLNHPGWPNDTSTLYSVHKELIRQHKIRGVEVFNGSESYPKALDWCNEYNLAFFANSDLHYASANSYREKLERPMTLVFVKDHTVEGIKEAVFAGRTLAYFSSNLAGKKEYLKEIIQKSISVKVINFEKSLIEICNQSDLPFEIRFGDYMYSIPLPPNQILKINIPSGTEVTFTNCMTGQNEYISMELW